MESVFPYGDVTMGPLRLNWDSEDTFNMFDSFNGTEKIEDDPAIHHTGIPFEIGNKSVAGSSEEMSVMRHSYFWTIVLVFAYVTVFLVGIVGNVMVVCVLTMKRQMKTVTNLFILNLAIADMFVVLFCVMPTLLANIFVRKLFTFACLMNN